CVCLQGEDGIGDWSVTGVQTCALPISRTWPRQARNGRRPAPLCRRLRGSRPRPTAVRRRNEPTPRPWTGRPRNCCCSAGRSACRSEERRGGEEGGNTEEGDL